MSVFPDFLTAAPEQCVQAFAPGRTEIAGNHVDHQGGTVIAAALARGMRARARANNSALVRVESAGFEPFTVDLEEARSHGCAYAEAGSSRALVAGMVCELERTAGAHAAGFDIAVESVLPAGGGLSSSAAFELLIGTVVNTLFFEERFSSMKLAQIAQRVETNWFGKPCGLMDQAIIALGGVVAIDFAEEEPVVEPLAFDFEAAGLSVVLVDVHADHADATPDYAAIPYDMIQAARLCGAARLGDVELACLVDNLDALRSSLGDAAALRALHFVHENTLVTARIDALKRSDVAAFCHATALSAASSAQYLQNVSELGSSSQPAMVALALADTVLDQFARENWENASFAAWPRGVARIHGGGFGGSIQVYLPTSIAPAFITRMDRLLGAGSCNLLEFSSQGAHATWM